MKDSRLEALRAMARQDESPRERDIARAKLQDAGMGWDEPPRRPPAAPAPSPEPFGFTVRSTGTATTNVGTGFGVYIRFTVRGT